MSDSAVTSSDQNPEVVTSPERDAEVDLLLTRYILLHFRVSQPVLGSCAVPSPSRREPRCAGGKGEALESLLFTGADLPKVRQGRQ